MKNIFLLLIVALLCILNFVSADTFGTGANQFDIDFVPISGDASSANGTDIGYPKKFSDPGTYRMGIYEITNNQWDKFVASVGGLVAGNPSDGYNADSYWTGTDIPTNAVSWFEAAQFVNWLNTSTGHQAAYKFTGTQGTGDYTFNTWDPSAAWEATNLYRHKDAYYFLPTEDEWVKAAYWNGMNLQTYATVGDVTPSQVGWNFYDNGYATDPFGPWDVGDGTKELNGTFDMMGNVWEWIESPYTSGDYSSNSYRGVRGSSFADFDFYLRSYAWTYFNSDKEYNWLGFRVASIPEPATLLLLGLGAVMIRRKRYFCFEG